MDSSMLFRMLLTLLVGCCGGLLALRLKIPAGGIVGSLFAVALFNVIFDLASFPRQSNIMTQAIAGGFIAAPITLNKIKALRSVLKPAVIVVVGMLLLSIGIAWICFTISSMNLITAFFSSAPGGLTGLVLISAEMGADPLQVPLIHTIRVFFNLGFVSIISKYFAAWFERRHPALCVLRHESSEIKNTDQQEFECGNPALYVLGHENGDIKSTDQKKIVKSNFNAFISVIVALVGGFLGYFSGIPAGAMIFGMIFVGILNVTTNRAYMPLNLRRFTQVCAGAIIGSTITRANLMGIPIVILPLIIVMIGNIIMTLGLGLAVFFIGKLDIHSALFSSIPAGVGDMALVADELGGDGPKVALIQTFRMFCTITIFPQVYLWIVENISTG